MEQQSLELRPRAPLAPSFFFANGWPLGDVLGACMVDVRFEKEGAEHQASHGGVEAPFGLALSQV